MVPLTAPNSNSLTRAVVAAALTVTAVMESFVNVQVTHFPNLAFLHSR